MFSLIKCVLVSLSLILYSCSDHSKNNAAVLKALDEGITSSNKIINAQSLALYNALEHKLYETGICYRAQIWYPKAMQIQKLSGDMFNYIEDVKNELLKYPNPDEAIEAVLIKQKKGEELSNKLNQYRMDMLNVDSFLKRDFAEILLLPPTLDSMQRNKKGFDENLDKSISAGFALLNEFQNAIRIFEIKSVYYCSQQTVINFDGYISHEPLIAQTSKYVKMGEEFEIKAGIGAFEVMANPKIIIDGKNVPIGDYGYAEFKFKISSKPGKYRIPIKMQYSDQDGNLHWIDRLVEYTVTE